jgi:hypothetical protein
MKATLAVLNQMRAEGVIGAYAIGGAVGATFYLEPVATLDLDVFVLLKPVPGSMLLTLSPIYDYLTAHGHRIEGEYVIVEGWPVQFLPPAGPLEEEAITQSVTVGVEGVSVSVMTAEHLVAIALATGRAKDYSRILQFIEAGALDTTRLDALLARHGLLAKWAAFGEKFLHNTP